MMKSVRENTLLLFAVVIVFAVLSKEIIQRTDFLSLEKTASILPIILTTALFFAMNDFSSKEIHNMGRKIVSTVTIGVLLKIFIIFSMLYIAGNFAVKIGIDDVDFFDKENVYIYIAALSITVAQIDPIATSMSSDRIVKSEKARIFINSWACFDDPITVILATVLAIDLVGFGDINPIVYFINSDVKSYTAYFGIYTALIAAMLFFVASKKEKIVFSNEYKAPAYFVLFSMLMFISLSEMFALVGLIAIAMPKVNEEVAKVIKSALFIFVVFYSAWNFELGEELVIGMALGIFAFLSQVIVGAMFCQDFEMKEDRYAIMFCHQNGLTALMLGSFFAPLFDGYNSFLTIIIASVLTSTALFGLVFWSIENKSAKL